MAIRLDGPEDGSEDSDVAVSRLGFGRKCARQSSSATVDEDGGTRYLFAGRSTRAESGCPRRHRSTGTGRSEHRMGNALWRYAARQFRAVQQGRAGRRSRWRKASVAAAEAGPSQGGHLHRRVAGRAVFDHTYEGTIRSGRGQPSAGWGRNRYRHGPDRRRRQCPTHLTKQRAIWLEDVRKRRALPALSEAEEGRRDRAFGAGVNPGGSVREC